MAESELSPTAITANLGTRFIGQRIIYYPRLTSTNDIARQEARRGTAEGTIIIADEQTAGKGRIKRIWLSPKENVALSVIFYPNISCLPYIVMLASLAVVHSIEAVTGIKSQLKWPNDVLINGKKVCGILCESDVRENAIVFAIAGIGINVNLRLSDFPEIASTATSLAEELGRPVSRLDVVRRLLVEIEKLYLLLSEADPIYQEWRDRLITLGRKVQVKSGEKTLEGVAESVARDGSLLLRHSDGDSTRIVAGDVTLRYSP